MKRTLLALAVAATATLVPATSAHADSLTIQGRLCSATSIFDPTAGDDWTMIAEVEGGPVAVADTGDPAANPIRVTMTCTIRVGWDHTGTAVASAAGSGIGVATVPPTVVRFETEPYAWWTVCASLIVTNARDETRQLYWDDSRGEYGASPSVPCYDLAPPCAGCGPVDLLLDLVLDTANAVFIDHVDPALCPVLASQAPGVPGVLDVTPEGDVHLIGWGLFWDCPPYGS